MASADLNTCGGSTSRSGGSFSKSSVSNASVQLALDFASLAHNVQANQANLESPPTGPKWQPRAKRTPGRHRVVEVTCKHCGVTVERQELGAGKVQRFCTNRCAGLAAQAAGTFRGENNPRFAGWKSRDKVAYRKRFQARYPEKASAHRAVAYALQRGTLVRGPCEACGAELAQAHHDDYSRKLDVRWLCRPCHRTWHQANDRPMGSAGVRRAVP